MSATSVSPLPYFRRKRVLLIEDEPPLIKVAKSKLEKELFEVIVARSVDQAMECLQSSDRVDAIWLDHFLQGRQTGLDFLSNIKKLDSRWKNIPVFVVTNTAGSETDEEYTVSGVDRLYSKAAVHLDTIISDIKSRLHEDPVSPEKKVLIVDDDASLRQVLVAKLTHEGFIALSAVNGLEGLHTAIDEKPDVILLDILMPVMGGLEMLEKLRQDPWGRTAQVILLTNSSDLNDVDRAMRNHAFEFLVKSNWSLEAVVNKIKEKLDM